jgi:hypothetical protein
MKAWRLSHHLSLRVRDACVRLPYGPKVHEKIKDVTEKFLDQFVEKSRDKLGVEVTKCRSTGEFIVIVRGPRELIRGSIGGFLAIGTGIKDPLFVCVKGQRRRLGVNKPELDDEVDCVITITPITITPCELDGQVLKVVDGGITGYESFIITEAVVMKICEKGWWACMGTPGSWDSLYFPAEEMRRVFDAFGILGRMRLT